MKIALINMPFAPAEAPSLGLTQLAAVIERRFGAQIELYQHYLNLDFAAKLRSSGFYDQAISPYGRLTGLGEWFFRAAAFPDAPNNLDEYLARFYFDEDSASRSIVAFVREHLDAADNFLDEMIIKYDLASVDVIGFTLNFYQTTASIAMARKLKQLNPLIMVVFGGPAVRGVSGKVLIEKIPVLDYVFSGAALLSFPRFVDALLRGVDPELKELPGVFAAGADEYAPPERNFGDHADINELLNLNYEPFLKQFDATMQDSGATPYLLLQSSRGCWWADQHRCTFCGLNPCGEKFEAMRADRALQHINAILRYADRVSYFAACDNVVPPNYFEEVFPHLQPPARTFIKYEIRSDITEHEIEILCKAGIRCVQPGIEALSTATLKLMGKGVSAFRNITFLKSALRYGVVPEWNILIGTPGERIETYVKYLQDIPRLMHLPPPEGVFPIEFTRDSFYFEHPEAYGLTLDPIESQAYIYPFDEQSLKDLSFQFIDRNSDHALLAEWLDKLGRLIEQWRQRWYRSISERPRLIMWRDEYSMAVCDSRGVSEEIYRISDMEVKVLDVLQQPLDIKEVAAKLDVDEHQVKTVVAALSRHNLLFEEKQRYLNLCMKTS